MEASISDFQSPSGGAKGACHASPLLAQDRNFAASHPPALQSSKLASLASPDGEQTSKVPSSTGRMRVASCTRWRAACKLAALIAALHRAAIGMRIGPQFQAHSIPTCKVIEYDLQSAPCTQRGGTPIPDGELLLQSGHTLSETQVTSLLVELHK